ncbi:MAG: hypothetical protein UH077_04590 [Bacteroidales bacterium]|nr:hypothetical protein [Bacteroidales bacterium]
MDNLTCNMCGSPDVKLEGNYYICNSCGSKYKSHDFNELSSNERILTEEEKAELERLKTYLEKDHSLAKRILELEPNNWLAYRIEYYVGDRWFELLRDSGMTQKEIEKALTIHYYEKEKSSFSKLLEYYSSVGKISDSSIDKFFKNLNSTCLHILSILGDEYSELTKSWQEDAEKFIDECKETVKRNLKEEKKEDNRTGNGFLIAGIIILVITGPMYFINHDFLMVSITGIVIGLLPIIFGLVYRCGE